MTAISSVTPDTCARDLVSVVNHNTRRELIPCRGNSSLQVFYVWVLCFWWPKLFFPKPNDQSCFRNFSVASRGQMCDPAFYIHNYDIQCNQMALDVYVAFPYKVCKAFEKSHLWHKYLLCLREHAWGQDILVCCDSVERNVDTLFLVWLTEKSHMYCLILQFKVQNHSDYNQYMLFEKCHSKALK